MSIFIAYFTGKQTESCIRFYASQKYLYKKYWGGKLFKELINICSGSVSVPVRLGNSRHEVVLILPYEDLSPKSARHVYRDKEILCLGLANSILFVPNQLSLFVFSANWNQERRSWEQKNWFQISILSERVAPGESPRIRGAGREKTATAVQFGCLPNGQLLRKRLPDGTCLQICGHRDSRFVDISTTGPEFPIAPLVQMTPPLKAFQIFSKMHGTNCRMQLSLKKHNSNRVAVYHQWQAREFKTQHV